MRPKKYYVLFDEMRRAFIVHGCAEARRLGTALNRFATRLDAEEWAAWWQYEHPSYLDRPLKSADELARLSAPRNKALEATTPATPFGLVGFRTGFAGFR